MTLSIRLFRQLYQMTRLPSSLASLVLALALPLAGCGSSAPLERYGFVARLGRDTISVESVTRYPDRIVSDEVDRFPDVRRRHTELELAADGSLRHMDMHVLIPSATARSRDRRIVADINGKILDGNRKAASGPPLNLMPFDVERVVGTWRERRTPP